MEFEDDTIQVPFNGEFAPFVGQEKFFAVKVNGKPFAIKSVTINAKDATLLNIKLVEPSYRSDVISISLLPGSPLTSTDERVPQVFTEVPVGMHNVNLLPKQFMASRGEERAGYPFGTTPLRMNSPPKKRQVASIVC